MNIRGSLAPYWCKCELCWLRLLGAREQRINLHEFPSWQKVARLRSLSRELLLSHGRTAPSRYCLWLLRPPTLRRCVCSGTSSAEGERSLVFWRLGTLPLLRLKERGGPRDLDRWAASSSPPGTRELPNECPWVATVSAEVCQRDCWPLRSPWCGPIAPCFPRWGNEGRWLASRLKGKLTSRVRVELSQRCDGPVPRMFVCRIPHWMLEEPRILHKWRNSAVVLLFSFPQLPF